MTTPLAWEVIKENPGPGRLTHPFKERPRDSNNQKLFKEIQLAILRLKNKDGRDEWVTIKRIRESVRDWNGTEFTTENITRRTQELCGLGIIRRHPKYNGLYTV
jgi:hypothetical protein